MLLALKYVNKKDSRQESKNKKMYAPDVVIICG
jgi:hypothetical protein